METIFSKIIKREIPAHIIYEDTVVLAFLDINPVHPGHTLVIPKQACENALDCDPETLGHMMRIGQKIAQALRSELGVDGVNFIMNNGAAAGQEVFHAHLHVVPRYENDNRFTRPGKVSYQAGEAEQVQQQLQAVMG